MIPVTGKIQGHTVRLEEDWPVPEGARVEGWAFEPTNLSSPTKPLGLDEARELLGHEVVVACTRRGIDLRTLDWNAWVGDGFTTTIWYKVVRALDTADPWPIWLPLFAHLLRAVRHDPDSVWLHMGNVQVTITGFLERGLPGAASLNARLISLLVLRVVGECLERTTIGPHNLFEIWNEVGIVLQACLRVEEEQAA